MAGSPGCPPGKAGRVGWGDQCEAAVVPEATPLWRVRLAWSRGPHTLLPLRPRAWVTSHPHKALGGVPVCPWIPQHQVAFMPTLLGPRGQGDSEAGSAPIQDQASGDS